MRDSIIIIKRVQISDVSALIVVSFYLCSKRKSSTYSCAYLEDQANWPWIGTCTRVKWLNTAN